MSSSISEKSPRARKDSSRVPLGTFRSECQTPEVEERRRTLTTHGDTVQDTSEKFKTLAASCSQRACGRAPAAPGSLSWPEGFQLCLRLLDGSNHNNLWYEYTMKTILHMMAGSKLPSTSMINLMNNHNQLDDYNQCHEYDWSDMKPTITTTIWIHMIYWLNSVRHTWEMTWHHN